MSENPAVCQLCGEPMPQGEEMFKYHGYSGPCPVSPKTPPYIARMLEEKEQLMGRIVKLQEFIFGNSIYAYLSQEKKDLLLEQFEHMDEYLTVLMQRIKLELS